jgi:predicted secreted protein
MKCPMKAFSSGAILVCLLLLGCGHSTEPIELEPVHIDATVDGKTLQYMRDQEFALALDSYADAGYLWDWEISDTLVVSMMGEPSYKPNNPNVCGGLCTATFRFRTKMSGYCVVTLIEHQRWMKDVPPRCTVKFAILVPLRV